MILMKAMKYWILIFSLFLILNRFNERQNRQWVGCQNQRRAKNILNQLAFQLSSYSLTRSASSRPLWDGLRKRLFARVFQIDVTYSQYCALSLLETSRFLRLLLEHLNPRLKFFTHVLSLSRRPETDYKECPNCEICGS